MTTHKVAIITGASGGIGAGLVAGYRKRNWAVAASSRTIKRSQEPDLVIVAGDITEPASAGRIVDTALDRFGRIDTLVNNAGVVISKPSTGYTAADYATVVGVGLTGSSGRPSAPSARWRCGTAATWSTSAPPWLKSLTPARPRC